MFTNDCERSVAKVIDTISKYEIQIEDIRIQLAKNANFSPYHSFKRINKTGSGSISEEELNTFLKSYGLAIPEKQFRKMFMNNQNSLTSISYNNFLTHVLPGSDLESRGICLERMNKKDFGIDDSFLRDLDRLISAIYQKEYEFSRALEGSKNKILIHHIGLIDNAFLRLIDNITGFLSFKSVSAFMKENGYTFGKKEYESFMRRIDQNSKGRVTSTDFKFQLFPLGTLDELSQSFNHEFQQNRTGPLFGGISPIKHSPKKSKMNTDIKIPAENQACDVDGFEERGQYLSPSKNQYHNNPDIRIPSGPIKNTSSPNGIKSENKPADFQRSKSASMRNSLMYQTVPETNYEKSYLRSPIQNRHVDPIYNRYWNQDKEHNETLSPEYFNYIVKRTLFDYQGKTSESRPFYPSYYNQSLVENNYFSNLQRYPENPFRYTDHRHYFQNYFCKLRRNYYDDYYNVKHNPIHATHSQSQIGNSPTKITQDPNFLRQEKIAQRRLSGNFQSDQNYEIKINSYPLSHTSTDGWKANENLRNIHASSSEQSKPYSYVVINQ